MKSLELCWQLTLGSTLHSWDSGIGQINFEFNTQYHSVPFTNG